MIAMYIVGGAALALPQARKKAKGIRKEQSNLAAFNIKPKYPPHDDDALVRAKVCSTICLSVCQCAPTQSVSMAN